jgi:hypothetical protein
MRVWWLTVSILMRSPSLRVTRGLNVETFVVPLATEVSNSQLSENEESYYWSISKYFQGTIYQSRNYSNSLDPGLGLSALLLQTRETSTESILSLRTPLSRCRYALQALEEAHMSRCTAYNFMAYISSEMILWTVSSKLCPNMRHLPGSDIEYA